MAERSQEVEQALTEMVEAMAASDLDRIGKRTSREPGVLTIGSDASEWVEGHDEIVRLLRESMSEGAMSVSVGMDDVTGFSEGTVGWAASRGWFEVEGKRIPVRSTAVFHQEDGEWRVVQAHSSIPVPNDRMTDPMFQSG